MRKNARSYPDDDYHDWRGRQARLLANGQKMEDNVDCQLCEVVEVHNPDSQQWCNMTRESILFLVPWVCFKCCPTLGGLEAEP